MSFPHQVFRQTEGSPELGLLSDVGLCPDVGLHSDVGLRSGAKTAEKLLFAEGLAVGPRKCLASAEQKMTKHQVECRASL
jgi:hypothetical protein